jgi:hypothetical protein
MPPRACRYWFKIKENFSMKDLGSSLCICKIRNQDINQGISYHYIKSQNPTKQLTFSNPRFNSISSEE